MKIGAQIRGARAMLDWSQSELALRSGVAQKTIERAEASGTLTAGRTTKAIEDALVGGGIWFLELEGSPGLVLRVEGVDERLPV